MATKKPAPVIDIPFDDLRPLLGKPTDDTDVLAILKRASAKWGKPDGGDSYAVAKQAGFDLLARRPKNAKRGSPLLVNTIFLYPDGRDGHRQFPRPPHAITFTTRKDVLSALPKPERTWKIGKGKVPVTTKDPDHDRWVIDGVHLSVEYNDDLAVREITVSVIED